MYSFGVPQMLIAGYLVLVTLGTPFLRLMMIKSGARGFCSWKDFWKTWSVDATTKIALVGVLYGGGFWN